MLCQIEMCEYDSTIISAKLRPHGTTLARNVYCLDTLVESSGKSIDELVKEVRDIVTANVPLAQRKLYIGIQPRVMVQEI